MLIIKNYQDIHFIGLKETSYLLVLARTEQFNRLSMGVGHK